MSVVSKLRRQRSISGRALPAKERSKGFHALVLREGTLGSDAISDLSRMLEKMHYYGNTITHR